MRPFKVVIPNQNGGIEVYPLKEWLRQNPQHIPSDMDPTHTTSHQLRNTLKKVGWTVNEQDTEVRLSPPGVALPNNDSAEDYDVSANEIESDKQLDQAFGLEAQLRDFLAQNIETIEVEGRRLKLYVDPTGRDGIEYPTAVGPIDILAVDDAQNFFVFELKRGRVADRAIGQLSRYMGWVSQTIGREKGVNGVIVAKNIDERLRYAVLVVPNTSLFEYEVKFQLQPVNSIGA